MSTLRETLESHYEEELGPPTRRRALRSRAASADIWTWSPEASGRSLWLSASLGACVRPEPGPEQTQRDEFFIALEQALDVDARLAALAGYREGTGIAPAPGNMIPFERPLWPETEMETLLVVRPREPPIAPLALADGARVGFLQAIPLHASERDYALRVGGGELIERFEAEDVPFWDGTRPPAELD